MAFGITRSREFIDAYLTKSAWGEISFKIQDVLNRHADLNAESDGDYVHVCIYPKDAEVYFEIINHALMKERSCKVTYSHS